MTREFKDCTAADGIYAVSSLISRLTLLRRLKKTGPVSCICRLMAALSEGDVMLAGYCYHELTAELIASHSRRVSGDLWKDYLLSELLETENDFSAMAARGEKDLPLMNAMRCELTLLSALASLSSGVLRDWIGERFRELKFKPRQQKDSIALMSSAVWTGGEPRPLKEASVSDPLPPLPGSLSESEWMGWEYEAAPEFGDYVSDEALEEIYHRLLNCEDWRNCLEDLWNFHAAYGTGEFLKHRLFVGREAGLVPMEEGALPEEETLLLHEEERAAIMKEAIRFMQGEASERLLVVGGPGVGKTMSVLSLARELPEVRLILTNGNSPEKIMDICGILRAQPLRFLLLIDDVDLSNRAFSALRTGFVSGSIGAANILTVVTAREGDDSLFSRRVELKYPPFKEFVELVQRLLSREGIYAEYDEVQDACLDHKAAVKGELSFTSAARVAERLRAKYKEI